jgi:hypothetical protein
MPYVESFLSNDQSLYAISDSGVTRAYTEFTTAMTGWTTNNTSTFAISLENREYPYFYTFELQSDNLNDITISINDIPIPGVVSTNFNSYNLIGHALFKSDSEITVSSTLSVKSTLDSLRNSSSSAQTQLTAFIQSPAKTGEISVFRKKTSLISEVFGNGTFVKYIGGNDFTRGESINIYNTSLLDFESTPTTVQYATSEFFTVNSNIKGHVFPNTAYAEKADPILSEQSLPFRKYSGEDLLGDISFRISGHNRNKVYLTIPKIVDMNRIFASYSTRFGMSTFPQVLIDIDQASSPKYPIARLLHSLTSSIESVVDRYASIDRVDPNLRPGFVAVNDDANKSYLVDPDIALPEYYDWLTQIIGQAKPYASVYSNKAADYDSTMKVRCATTGSITISTALNNGDSIDGVALSTGDRVLVKNQSTASENGIYIVGDTPARWSSMAASSASITGVLPATPSPGYVTHTATAHGLNIGQPVVIAGLAPSGYNGQFIIDSVTTNTFTVASTVVATVTDSVGTAKKALSTTSPELIFIRQGTVNKMTMWSPSGATWPVIGDDSIAFVVKQVSAVAATTSNITTSTALVGGQVIDGITLVTGGYVLVKNQTTASENGLYKVAATPLRAENMAATLALSAGFRAYVSGGTVNAETMFTLNSSGVVNTSSLAFSATRKPFAWDDQEEFKLWQIQNKYYGYKAGSLQSLEETVKRYLIGTKTVRINYSRPFGIIISTLRDETLGIYDNTTSSELILNAIAPIVPMGFSITNVAVDNFAVFTIGSSIIGTGELG